MSQTRQPSNQSKVDLELEFKNGEKVYITNDDDDNIVKGTILQPSLSGIWIGNVPLLYWVEIETKEYRIYSRNIITKEEYLKKNKLNPKNRVNIIIIILIITYVISVLLLPFIYHYKL